MQKKECVSETNSMMDERLNYDSLRDSWRGRSVSTPKHINDFTILGGIAKW